MNLPQENIFCKKEEICKKIFLDDIEALIKEKLSSRNLEQLEIVEDKLNLRDQIFLRYLDNRYFVSGTKDEVLEAVGNLIDQYQFLLDSDLDSTKIRYAFMKALMDVISLGSGTFCLLWDSWYDKFGYDQQQGVRNHNFIKKHKYWQTFRFTFSKISHFVKQEYPLIPDTIQWVEGFYVGIFRRNEKESLRRENYPFSQQLMISYSYPLFLLNKRRKINIDAFENEFFAKHKGCLERLSKCNHIFLNKYREELCRNVSCDLGLDPDPSYLRVFFFFLNDLISIPRDLDFLFLVSNIIIECLSPEELDLFDEKDVNGDIRWSFESQINDRYYSKYPSFAPMREIEENIRRKIDEYKPLLNSETEEVVKELIFDEIERECFVSKTTHLWNIEMLENLENRKIKGKNKKVAQAVDILISFIPKDVVESFSIEVEGKSCSLKEQLLARGKRAWLASSLKTFRDYLSDMHIYTPYSIINWKNKTAISRIDLQAFLEEIDMFFLYPNGGRFIKKIFYRLDTGRTLGLKNFFRVKMSFYGSEPFKLCVLIFLLIALVVGVVLAKELNGW